MTFENQPSVSSRSPVTLSSVRRKRLRPVVILLVAVILGSLTGIAIIKALNVSINAGPLPVKLTTNQGGFSPLDKSTSPSWSLPSLVDPTQQISLSKFLGRPVILNFWASWCVPCQEEMPVLAGVSKQMGARVEFIGVNTADQRGLAQSFLSKTGVTYPIAFDPVSKVGSQYGVYGLPVTIFISSSGKLLGREVGGLSTKSLELLIHKLFMISVPS